MGKSAFCICEQPSQLSLCSHSGTISLDLMSKNFKALADLGPGWKSDDRFSQGGDHLSRYSLFMKPLLILTYG